MAGDCDVSDEAQLEDEAVRAETDTLPIGDYQVQWYLRASPAGFACRALSTPHHHGRSVDGLGEYGQTWDSSFLEDIYASPMKLEKRARLSSSPDSRCRGQL